MENLIEKVKQSILSDWRRSTVKSNALRITTNNPLSPHPDLGSLRRQPELLSDSWQGEPSRRIHQHENPIIPTPAGRRRERLDAPTVLLLEQVGDAVAWVVPVLVLSFGLDDALIHREALAARGIDDGE
jgi:hypothetical protein